MSHDAHAHIEKLANAASALSGVQCQKDARHHHRDELFHVGAGPLTLTGELVVGAVAKFTMGFHKVRALQAAPDKYDMAEISNYTISRDKKVGGLSFNAGQLSALAASLFEK